MYRAERRIASGHGIQTEENFLQGENPVKIVFHLMFSSNPRSLGAGIFLFRLTSVLKDPVIL